MRAFIIFFVESQEKATQFYKQVFNQEPTMNVPGMTEFTLEDGTLIGLMPDQNIKGILGEDLPDPALGTGTPRTEIYLMVEDPELLYKRSLEAGATSIQGLKPMPWGQDVAYSLDPDGHLIAFARSSS